MSLGLRAKFYLSLLAVAAVTLATRRVSIPLAAAIALITAIGFAFLLSVLLKQRVRALAATASRHRRSADEHPFIDYGSDELGIVAREFDGSVRELVRRIDELLRDRARLDAMLSGMVEGVLVVDSAGRLQLANRAAQSMLRMDASSIGRPYVEVIRHPDISAQLGTALRGDEVDSRELALTRDPGRTFVARAAPVARERRRRRRARPSRHHRSAARGSDPP